MAKTRYLVAFSLVFFLFLMRSTLLQKISNTVHDDSINNDEVQSILFREQKSVLLNNEAPGSRVAPRKLCGYTPEAKKAALQELEDVLLEPPRTASGKSRKYLKRTKFLPDLMGDSLESYPRRVFIDVGLPKKEGGSGTEWFMEDYPTRNQKFEIYSIETVTAELPVQQQIGISDWVRKNVKEEDYVVMKAEAEAVEEMMKGNSIGLVDELFLECKLKRGSSRDNTSTRAYWECLALYGKLKDEGVAVHQWWAN